MVNNNEKKRTLKEAYYEELSKKLEENPPEIPTYEEFSTMIDSHLAKKHRRKMRVIGIAASLAVVILAGILAFSQLAPDVEGDKNPKEEIITEDGVIIEDGGYGSSDGEDNVWVIEEWEDVKYAKEAYEGILVPRYIPKEYIFKQLKIERVETGAMTWEYIYSNQSQNIEIEFLAIKRGEVASSIEGNSKKIQTEKGAAYIQEDKNIATIQMYDGVIAYIFGNLSKEDIINIINGFTY